MEKIANQDTSLVTLLKIVEENINNLRGNLLYQAEKILPDIPPMGVLISGNIYIESVGSIVEFDDYGNFEYIYTPDSLTLRSPSLSDTEKAREKIFLDIAKQFPFRSRILNIGAGGDTIIPSCMENSDHEIISTDFSQSTIDILAKYINSPVFACDLLYLNEVLPESSVDFILGNSTLGYVDPIKLETVINNLSMIMKYGGVFTFDLSPHPVYFQMQEQKPHQTVANESEVDPTKLIELVERCGNINGINAMAYYSYYRTHYTNIAVLFLMKELFENEGLSCTTGIQSLQTDYGGIQEQLSLRVSKNFPQILDFITNEKEINKNTAASIIDDDKIWYRLAMIDRHNGEVLARKFGIHKSKREDAWNVVDYVHERLSAKDLPSEIKDEVLKEIDLLELVDKIRPFLHGKDVPKQIPLPTEIIADQTIHKMVIDGTTDMSPEEADAKIDDIYQKVKDKKRFKGLKRKQKSRKQLSKRKRKQARKSRKKNR
jgi:hypothetical protein